MRPRIAAATALVLTSLIVQSVTANSHVLDEAADRLASAATTQAATRASLLRVLGDAFTCPESRFVSYRRSSAEPEVADQWYVASQVWADAALLHPAFATPDVPLPPWWDAALTRCHVEKGFIFLDRLWDYETGGYYARADPTGLFVDRGARYADDNSLAGLALLATAEQLRDDPLARQRYLHAARREAAFLIESGLWDDTFGGGFWWNTEKGATLEGKPAQTNALAALFFGRLFETTGDPRYRTWALRTLLWMDSVLLDSARHLYRWSVHYEHPAQRVGAVLSERFFNYDQGIAIEAQLVAADLDGDPVRVPRARAIGRALHEVFWNADRGGYNLEAGVDQVFTSYAAWSSLGHLALFDLDGDERWLEMARANADVLAAVLQRPDGSYAYRSYRCVDQIAPGCESGRVDWVVDQTLDTTAQAWMQHLQTELARRLMTRSALHGEGPDVASGPIP